ncbi:hypothetical protein QE152_g27537 [Popillia japonica]|uniref:PiggyBac transposable element-derived protein domain-containing protein n=1 Tax=Popillia japonica TaxID=7064 RepID=A0AAW1JUM7_POPJA
MGNYSQKKLSLPYTADVLIAKGNYPYHIYCDNFFTTLPLLEAMSVRNLRLTGTIRENRLANCELECKTEIKKKAREPAAPDEQIVEPVVEPASPYKQLDYNVYYGFKHDLGVVKSTLYKSYGYVAKELLIKLRGERSLAQYAGWPRMVANQAAVDRLIANFETYRTEVALRPDDVEEWPADDHESTRRIQGLVARGADVYA